MRCNPQAPGGEDPILVMDNVLDMLKLLDYENKFCKPK